MKAALMTSTYVFFVIVFLTPTLSTGFSTLADDPVTIIRSKTSVTPGACGSAKNCSLKALTLKTDDYKVRLPGGPAYGTRMFAAYETDSLNTLENYGIVEFVSGCEYTSKVVNGAVIKSSDIGIQIGGRIVPFRFAKPIIDELLLDPMDWGDPTQNTRHYYYQWNTVPGSFDAATRRWYGEMPPTIPRLYVSDRPGTGFYNEETQTARNVSLRFKMCLYEARDVPRVVAPTNTNFATPLICDEWTSSWIYNHKTKTMESPNQIDSFCEKQAPPEMAAP